MKPAETRGADRCHWDGYGHNGFSSDPALIVSSAARTPQRTVHSIVVTRSFSPCRTGRATEQCGQQMPSQRRLGSCASGEVDSRAGRSSDIVARAYTQRGRLVTSNNGWASLAYRLATIPPVVDTRSRFSSSVSTRNWASAAACTASSWRMSSRPLRGGRHRVLGTTDMTTGSLVGSCAVDRRRSTVTATSAATETSNESKGKEYDHRHLRPQINV